MNRIDLNSGSQFSQIFRKSGWYAAGTLFPKALGFVLLPVYTYHLSPDEYGVVGTLTAIAQVLPFLVGLALASAYGRYFFLETSADDGDVTELFSTHFWFVLCWGAVATLCGIAVVGFVMPKYFNIPFWPLVPMAIAPGWLAQISLIGETTLENELNARTVTLLRLAARIVDYAVVLTLLIPFDAGATALLAGPLAGSMILATFTTVTMIRRGLLRLRFSRPKLRRSLRYSLPLVVLQATGWINMLSDRLILAWFGPIAQVGVYTVSNQVAGLAYHAVHAITRVHGPIALSALTRDIEQGKARISQFLSFYVWVMTGVYLALCLFAREVALLFDAQYHSAWETVALLALPFVVSGFYRPFSHLLSFHERTRTIATGGILAALLNAGLNIIFIPRYGQMAAAVTTATSGVFYAAWIVSSAQRLDRVHLNWAVIRPSLAAGLLVFAAGFAVDRYNSGGLWIGIALKTMMLCAYVLLTLLSPPLRSGVLRHLSAVRLSS